MQVVWIVIAAAGALVALIGLGRVVANLPPRLDRDGAPSTPLERLGWVGLFVTTGIGAGLALLLALRGASGFNQDGVVRGVFAILILAGLGTWALAWRIVSRPTGRAVVDERDQGILARSISVESMVVILSLVAWTVALTEVFWDEGAIPLEYLQLLFWTTFIGGAFGRSLGIVLGYRREPLVDA